MTSKKILVILIIIIMTAALFTSCDETDEDTQTTTADSSQQKEDGGVALLPDLPDYPDDEWESESTHALRILALDWSSDTWSGIWTARDISAEEETGDPINDAVYRRNLALEEKYNFTIEQLLVTHPLDSFRHAVAANDDYFDIASILAFTNFGGISTFAQEGLLVDLFKVNYLDFEKPWWEQGIIKGTSIGNKLFFASGDFTLINRDATAVMLFNKGLLKDLRLENPYELVRNGQWTISKLYEMAKGAASDLDGDGQMTLSSDRYGFVMSVFAEGPIGLRLGAGVRHAGIGADGIPVLTFGSERDYKVIDAVNDLWQADFSAVTNNFYGASWLTQVDSAEYTFAGNRALFIQTLAQTIEGLRGADIDFGILPMPRLDETQKEWAHALDRTFAQAIGIPNVHSGVALDRIGFMLEAISAESRYTVIPAYYDIQLQGKFVRDEESREMLGIIFNSTVWDPGLVYSWFGVEAFYLDAPSDYERERGRIEAAMQATIDGFKAVE